MRRLVPSPPGDEPLDSLYGDLVLTGEPGRPAVSLGMVASIDGAATVDGRTAELGDAADRVAFRSLRAACDAILVGAGTVRDERYGPPRGSEQRRADRTRRGLTPVPRLVIVSATLALDPDQRTFSDPRVRPLIVTHAEASREREDALAPVADVVRFGDESVDLVGAVEHLGDLGLTRLLCEGGPTLNGALLGADLVDEVFLTVAAVLVGGTAPRIITGPGSQTVRGMELVELREHDSELLLRYRRAGWSGPGVTPC